MPPLQRKADILSPGFASVVRSMAHPLFVLDAGVTSPRSTRSLQSLGAWEERIAVGPPVKPGEDRIGVPAADFLRLLAGCDLIHLKARTGTRGKYAAGLKGKAKNWGKDPSFADRNWVSKPGPDRGDSRPTSSRPATAAGPNEPAKAE